jgi:DNA-binding transcriptional ArsR family regulator
MSVFDVLADRNRRRILDLLRASERPVGEVVAQLDISQPAVSKHLRILREAGFVEVRSDAQRRLYSVQPEALRALDEWLAPYRQMWSSRLEDLERHLEEMSETESSS